MRAAVTMTRRAFLHAAATAVGAGSFVGRSEAADLGPGQYPLRLDSERDGLLYLPRGYKADVPAPLLVMFHGAGSTAQGTTTPLLRRVITEVKW